MKVAVVGGGAAGFFAAISIKQHHSKAEVHILEKSQEVLSKVKISGGGRCNVTHQCNRISEMVKHYPRGSKLLKKVFGSFFTTDTLAFFESRGVAIKAEADGRMFPVTDQSQSIIDCLMNETKSLGIEILYKQRVKSIASHSNRVELNVNGSCQNYDKVILATGGVPNIKGFQWLDNLKLNIVSPVPSLFTFNLTKNPITELQGVSLERVLVELEGAKWKAEGPILITHWGFSGPAVLRLSAFAAEWLHGKNYEYVVKVNWWNQANEEVVRSEVKALLNASPKRKLANLSPPQIPSRLWVFLLHKAEIKRDARSVDLSKKHFNKLINVLTNDAYPAKGKTTFKEEFVTCGGVDLSEIKADSMALKSNPNIYLAGELLNVDGVTGGFNFQAAWSTGYLAGKLL